MIHTISELLKEVSEFKSEFFDEQIYYRGQKKWNKSRVDAFANVLS